MRHDATFPFKRSASRAPFAKTKQSCGILRQNTKGKAWEVEERFHCGCVWAVVMSWLEWGTVLHRFGCLNTWVPAGGAVRRKSRWSSLAGGSMSAGAGFIQLTLLPVHSLHSVLATEDGISQLPPSFTMPASRC